jgi:GntR family transcriptional repressor for pyruvate dehydrogenase complex
MRREAEIILDYNTEIVNRTSLSQQISEQLIENIHSGVFEPGSLLPSENELSKKFGVSRPVIRESLKYLAAQGFIRIINGKGTIVEEVNGKLLEIFFKRALSSDPETWIELMNVRKILEAKSASLAARNRTEEELSKLNSIFEQMIQNKDNLTEYSKLDIQFHIELVVCSRNTFLYHLINTIRGSLVVVLQELRLDLDSSQLPMIQEFHEKILNAVRKQDGPEAERMMNLHFDNVIQRIKSYPRSH